MNKYEISDGVQTADGGFTVLLTTFGTNQACALAIEIAKRDSMKVYVWHRVALTLVQLFAGVDSNGTVTYY